MVTSKLNLLVAGANDTDITWTADPAGYVNPTTGAVTRPEHNQGDQTVTLTATISKEGGTAQTKDFTITIKAKSAPYVPQPEPQPDPEPSSVITPLIVTEADRLLDRSLIKVSKAQISLGALQDEELAISAAVVKRLAEHKLPITLLAEDMSVTVDPAALLLEQIEEWGRGKAWFEIRVSKLEDEEQEAALQQWQLPAREGRFAVHGDIYQIEVEYWQDGQDSGMPIAELQEAITVKYPLPEELSEQELATLQIALVDAESDEAFSPVWLDASYNADSHSVAFTTTRLGRFALACLEQPTCVIDLTVNDHIGYVNGVEHIMDVPPCLVDDRTLVPVRFVAEAMGAKFDWLAATRTVRIKLNDQVVELVIGKTNAAKGLDVPAQIVANRTLVPLRFVSESLGASVRWLSATRSVEIVMF